MIFSCKIVQRNLQLQRLPFSDSNSVLGLSLGSFWQMALMLICFFSEGISPLYFPAFLSVEIDFPGSQNIKLFFQLSTLSCFLVITFCTFAVE